MSRDLRTRVVAGVKQTLATALYATGALSWLTRKRLRGRAVVLTYHRVLGDADLARTWSHPAIVVRTRTFDRHLDTLRRHFDVISLAEFTARIEAQQPFDRPACLITFDDGWLDTYGEAWPVLRAHQAPAVVFLPVDFIGTDRMFWQERSGALLSAIVDRAGRDAAFADRARAALAPHGLDGLIGLTGQTARLAIMDAMQTRKIEDPGSTRSPLQTLVDLAGDSNGGSADAFMTWTHVREMAADGISFGGHGVTHRLLTTLTTPEATAEVTGSRAALERELPGHAMSFCYPNGNWNPAIADAVRDAGFRVAFSTERGTAGPDSQRFAVRRINMHEDVTRSVPLFLARLAGVL